MTQSQPTLLFSHLTLLKHGREDHPENASRLETILSALKKSPLSLALHLEVNRMASREELSLIHSLEYIDHVLSLQGKSVDLDPETPLSPDSVEAALRATGLGLEMLDRVLEGKARNGFVLVRPPGHHARPHLGMGFCVFNNIAIAAKKALSRGIQKVLILDWDVHHGNGTQESFYEDDQVLFIDLHQDDLFPKNSGSQDEKGKGRGLGTTHNFPLPHSCTEEHYLELLADPIEGIIRKFAPEIILVSAGFDAHERDPLGSMSISTPGYRLLTQKIKALAEELCDGKLILFLEGGYQPVDLSENVIQCAEALAERE